MYRIYCPLTVCACVCVSAFRLKYQQAMQDLRPRLSSGNRSVVLRQRINKDRRFPQYRVLVYSAVFESISTICCTDERQAAVT